MDVQSSNSNSSYHFALIFIALTAVITYVATPSLKLNVEGNRDFLKSLTRPDDIQGVPRSL